ncbi:MAG: DUF551 domain-containing protein [Eubacteriales bacterium]|nr:DUF551 domain-containing protein [Eubacteriales bacterium]MDD4474353.1 DUF551 domain-containing protein [Eubacteriales bacterium]
MKWIPIKERLPEPNEQLIVSYNNGRINILIQWWADGQKPIYSNWDDDSDKYPVITVTAWMPLIEPYIESGASSL